MFTSYYAALLTGFRLMICSCYLAVQLCLHFSMRLAGCWYQRLGTQVVQQNDSCFISYIWLRQNSSQRLVNSNSSKCTSVYFLILARKQQIQLGSQFMSIRHVCCLNSCFTNKLLQQYTNK
ncbi:Hypothetical_protein [Hexamita inflata]|uniref:Hypothetical_protein n=1 Tax=Hexamita inflata TaxID=28002 RepID=A0ABP1GZ55_9EUKA